MDIHATKTSFPVYLPLMLLCLVLFDCSTLLGLIRGTSSNKIISASDSDPMQLSRGKKRSGVDDREFILIGKSSENFLTSWQIWQVKRSSHISWWILCPALDVGVDATETLKLPSWRSAPILVKIAFQSCISRESVVTHSHRSAGIEPFHLFLLGNQTPPLFHFLTFPTSHLRRPSNLFGIVQYPIFHFSWCS